MHSFLGVPIFVDGDVYGNLYLTDKRDGDEFKETDEEMVVGLAAAAAVAISNARLQIRAREVELLEDRERIARDLHDTVIQRLFATGLSLQGVVRLAVREEVADRIEATIDELDLTVREIRESIFELQPSTEVDVRSLRRELLRLGDELHNALGTVPAFVFDGPVDTEIDDELRTDVVAVVRESLTNIARHADATEADVTIALSEGLLTITATDDGSGPGPLRASGRGLGNMATRAETRGGRFEIGPNEPTGTRVFWQVPLKDG
jgi:signal transduction histidine kinase